MNLEINDILDQMSADEKISLACGHDFWRTRSIERLGIDQVMMCDGPHGLRKQIGEGDHLGVNDSIETVCYPSASALAAGFDTELLQKLGEALGKECQTEKVGMLLGPGVNMKRSPLCGRNFEYFSEDPYLAGQLAAAYIRALQAEGIAACVKHFAANNQETLRMSGNSHVSERALHEIYLPAFETAVKEGGVRSVMAAYNAVNGEFCTTSHKLLTEILRDRWGFEGFTVTDWGAGKDAVNGLKAGLDLNMPGGHDSISGPLAEAFELGEISVEELDRMAGRMLKFAIDAKRLQKPNAEIDRDACALLSEEIAAECAVLLKNDNILPLAKDSTVAMIGEFAASPRYQGSGSSHINCKKTVSALEAADGLTVRYAKGYETNRTETDEELLKEAIEAAAACNTAVVFAGLPDSFESEGFDRTTLAMPDNQNRLIKAVAAVNPNTVVVLHGGAPMMVEWIDNVRAVLCMYLGGQNVGKAAVDLLYGRKNPCGKLAETWPKKLSDNPSHLNFPGTDGDVEYAEGIFIGYRYYDKKEMDVLFPFGHGLSYTDFEYSSLKVDREKIFDTETIEVTCKVRNIGKKAGKEAVQLYVRNPQTEVIRPVRELRRFCKISLKPGEEKQISFTLSARDFAYYEEKIHDFFVESGVYGIEIGASSRDIRLGSDIEVTGTVELPYEYSMTSTIGSLRKTARGRALLEKMISGMNHRPSDSSGASMGEGGKKMMEKMMLEMPLQALTTFAGVPAEKLQEIVNRLNTN